jgi:hypothetical protein
MDKTFEHLKEFLTQAFADKDAFAISYSVDSENSTHASYNISYKDATVNTWNTDEAKDTVLVADTNRILNAVDRLGNDYEVGDPVINQSYKFDTLEVFTNFTIDYFD